MESVDALVIGRNTYETVLAFDTWPYSDKRVFVLSTRALAPAPAITRVPVLIGQGIPLFGSLPQDVPLQHVMTRHYQSGLVQSEYQIVV
jgi:dihydrofolate reductase